MHDRFKVMRIVVKIMLITLVAVLVFGSCVNYTANLQKRGYIKGSFDLKYDVTTTFNALDYLEKKQNDRNNQKATTVVTAPTVVTTEEIDLDITTIVTQYTMPPINTGNNNSPAYTFPTGNTSPPNGNANTVPPNNTPGNANTSPPSGGNANTSPPQNIPGNNGDVTTVPNYRPRN
jgi:hypothetical protein